MGFSNITSHVLLFVAVLLISTGVVIIFKGYIDASSNAIVAQQDAMTNQFQTDIKIENVVFDNYTNTSMNRTVVDVRNVGSSVLDPAYVFIYLDGRWVNRNESNLTMTVLNDTEIINIGDWDPKELLEVKIFGNINRSVSHTVKVTTPYGISDEEKFS